MTFLCKITVDFSDAKNVEREFFILKKYRETFFLTKQEISEKKNFVSCSFEQMIRLLNLLVFKRSRTHNYVMYHYRLIKQFFIDSKQQIDSSHCDIDFYFGFTSTCTNDSFLCGKYKSHLNY